MTGVVKGTIFAVGVGLIASLAIFTAIDYQVMHCGDGATKSHDEVTDGSMFRAANMSALGDLQYNRSIYISANATENWTIWKGDKMIAYIPRGA